MTVMGMFVCATLPGGSPQRIGCTVCGAVMHYLPKDTLRERWFREQHLASCRPEVAPDERYVWANAMLERIDPLLPLCDAAVWPIGTLNLLMVEHCDAAAQVERLLADLQLGTPIYDELVTVSWR